jgi:hypothetical protein
MNYLTWRLHRNQVIFAATALVALAVLLLVTGTQMAHDYSSALSTCATSRSCSDLSDELFQGDGLVLDFVTAVSIGGPLLLGMFWGAPLIAKEIDEGTHRLVWAQSITRRRWMATKVGWVLAAAVAWGASMSALVTWWHSPENALYGRLDSGHFDIQGIVPIAYSLFAVALGIAIGTCTGRVMAAAAGVLGGFAAARSLVVLYVRPHFLAPLTARLSLGGAALPGNPWVLSKTLVNAAGRAEAVTSAFGYVPAACHSAVFKGPSALSRCLQAQGYHWLVRYQPASRFWEFQAIEAALFVTLAAALVLLALRRVERADA